ncbi:MAG TPA: hypothetical protein PKD90_20010, partial [Phnomibacter sp.]|nr:hypothetical protein [Phnomibacter sp.]
LDVRNNGGGVTISLNGADGTITANNLPAFRRQSTNRATTQLGQGGSAVLESFKVVIPASGLVKISAKVFMYPTGNHNIAQRLEINDNTPGQFNTLATRQYILPQSYAGDFEIVWVGNLPTGNRLLELKLYNSSTVNWDITYHVSSIDVTYIGKQLDTW